MSANEHAARLMLLLQARGIAELHAWPPAGVLVDAATDFARGQGSLSEKEASRIRTWARRWDRVDQRVRAFYARHAATGWASAALWSILQGYPRPTGWCYGQILRQWEADHGYRSAIELVPRVL